MPPPRRTQPRAGNARPYKKYPLSGPGSGYFVFLVQFFLLLVGCDLDIHRPRQKAPQRHTGRHKPAGYNNRLAAGDAVQRTAHAVFRRDAAQGELNIRHGVELRVHRAGAEAARIHRAVGLLQLLRKGAGQADHIGLGGVVGRHIGPGGHQAGAGADIEQRAEALLIQLLADLFCQDMHCPDIDGQHIQILVQLGLQKRPAVAKACIVDKQIHPAILQRLGQPQTLALFGQIRRHDLTDSRKLVRQRFQPVSAAGHQHQVIPPGRQLPRKFGADARAGTGDNCKLRHRYLLLLSEIVRYAAFAFNGAAPHRRRVWSRRPSGTRRPRDANCQTRRRDGCGLHRRRW